MCLRKFKKGVLIKIKTNDSLKKEKYDAIKEGILKKVKKNEIAGEKSQEEVNFVNRQPLSRVTNAMIKSILRKKSENAESNKTAAKKVKISSFPSVDKQIKKKDKRGLKKEIWTKSILNNFLFK